MLVALTGIAERTPRRREFTHSIGLVAIILVHSIFRLYHIDGFPDLTFDEGVYLLRAQQLAATGDFYPDDFHDHPFFGWLLLTAAFSVAGVWAVEPPQILLLGRGVMAVIAISSGLLVYGITLRLGGSVFSAAVASALLAVTPASWVMRRVLLDNVAMLFILAALYAALRLRPLSAGLLLGVAAVSKLPALLFLPGLLLICARQGQRVSRIVGGTALPIAAWFGITLMQARLADVVTDLLFQVTRPGSPLAPFLFLRLVDPVFSGLAVVGMVYVLYRRDWRLLALILPYGLFLVRGGFTQYFHIVPLLPFFAIAAARVIAWPRFPRYVPVGIAFTLLAVLAPMHLTVISEPVTAAQLGTAELLRAHQGVAIVASPIYAALSYPDRLYVTDWWHFRAGSDPPQLVVVDRHFHDDLAALPHLQSLLSGFELVHRANLSCERCGDSRWYLQEGLNVELWRLRSG